MSLLLGALGMGSVLALLALGIFVSFRIFAFPDMTAEGSVTLGAAVAAALLVAGHDPVTATAAATAAGAVAGTVTGVLHTRFRLNGLLAGILVMTALYSINLHIMGRSNLPLGEAQSFVTLTGSLAARFADHDGNVQFLGRAASAQDLGLFIGAAIFAGVVCAALYLFFHTRIGSAMRATGDNPQMIRALGSNDGMLITAGLALSNALVALSGALLAQYQGFADLQMGIGMLVWGLASVIIGESLTGSGKLGYLLIGAILGSVLFRLLVAVALRWGLDPADLKLVTAVFVLIALVAPGMVAQLRGRLAGGAPNA